MKIIIALASLSLITGTSLIASAQSGFYIEPAITYELGETDGEIEFAGFEETSSGSVEGFGLATKIGMHIDETFFAAVDLRYSMPKFEDSALGGYSASAKAYQYGPVIGLQMPNWGARFWAGYVVGGQLDPEGDSGNSVVDDVIFEETQGLSLGGGIHYEAISINLEYQMLTYGDVSITNPGPDVGTVDSADYKNNSWVASVSFPFDL